MQNWFDFWKNLVPTRPMVWLLCALAMLTPLPSVAQSAVDLVRICAEAVASGQPPVLTGRAPFVSDGAVGDENVQRAWENLDSVAYLEFLSLPNFYDEIERTAHECRFELTDSDTDLTPFLAEMTAVLGSIGPVRTVDTDGIIPHALYACKADGLPLTLTVQRDDDGAFWIAAWDTTWDRPGC